MSFNMLITVPLSNFSNDNRFKVIAKRFYFTTFAYLPKIGLNEFFQISICIALEIPQLLIYNTIK